MENREIIIGADMSEEELMHYGRVGMKWGQHIFGKAKAAKTNRKRKKNLEKARQAKIEKARTAAEREKAIKAGKIKPKDMTDAELKARTERLQAEKNYNSLVSETNKVNASKAKEFLKSAAMGPGKKIFFDTSVDIAAQSFKTVGVQKVNGWLVERGYGFADENGNIPQLIYTNNKRK